ncbi:MAG: aromatic amino acid transport family protein [Candidatus Pacearchaeota archaeon]
MKRGLLFGAIATLTGTIVGAGIFGLPYVVAQSGFVVGLLNIIILGVIMLFINLYLGEISLRTKGFHQITGYASKYLGKPGKILMLFSMIFGIYTALVAYMLGEGEVLSFIFFGSQSYTLWFSLAFFSVMFFLVSKSLKALEEGESFGLIAVFTLIIIITLFFFPKLNTSNLAYISKPSMWFLPYGVTFFAFLAFSALPEIKQELKNNEKLMKKAILIGSLIPILLYIIFVTTVVGFSGKATPEIATMVFGKLPCLLAVFTMFTAFFTLASAIRDMYRFDFNFKKTKAWLLACLVPLAVFIVISLFKAATFIQILSLSGSISGGLAGILIVLMIKKAKKLGNRKPEYSIPISWPIITILIALFIFGMIYQFLF